jgi:DNA-binding SARP family transcriptional activator
VASIELRILGPLEAWNGDHPIPLGGRKQRALLALLALEPDRVVPLDRIVEALWADMPPGGATHTVQVYVSNLRRALRDGAAFEYRDPGYRIQVDAHRVDLFVFERLADDGRAALAAGEASRARELLRRALEVWRGPALADFLYEPWAQAPIARLEELRLATLEERIAADLGAARHREVVAELESLVETQPLRERLWAQLMLALYRADRQADALAAYRRARTALVDGLGLEPGESLRQLERAILAQDPGLALDPATPERAPASQAQRSILVEPEPVPIELASVLARSGPGHELILFRLLPAGDGARLTAAIEGVASLGAALVDRGSPCRTAVFTSGDPARDAIRLASEQDVDLVLLGLPEETRETGKVGRELEQILAETPCDVGLVSEPAGAFDVAKTVVPFGGAEHDWAALELGAWIARAAGNGLVLLGTSGDPAGTQRDASRLLASASLAVQRLVGVTASVRLIEPGAEALLEQGRDEPMLVVVGLSSRWRQEGLGEARLALLRRTSAPVVVVRRGPRPGGLASPPDQTRYTWSLAMGARAR